MNLLEIEPEIQASAVNLALHLFSVVGSSGAHFFSSPDFCSVWSSLTMYKAAIGFVLAVTLCSSVVDAQVSLETSF